MLLSLSAYIFPSLTSSFLPSYVVLPPCPNIPFFLPVCMSSFTSLCLSLFLSLCIDATLPDCLPIIFNPFLSAFLYRPSSNPPSLPFTLPFLILSSSQHSFRLPSPLSSSTSGVDSCRWPRQHKHHHHCCS